MKKIFLIILPFLLTPGLSNNCQGNWCLEELFFNDHLVAYYLNAIDLDTGQQNFDLFQYRLHEEVPDDLPDTFEFTFTISIYSPQLGFEIFETFGTLTATVTILESELVVRNTDLSGDTQPSGAVVTSVNWTSIDLSEGGYEAYNSIILQSGKLPNGIYQFTSNFSGDNSDLTLVQTLEVYEPVFLELLAPGGELNRIDEHVIHSTYPVFSWNADYCAESNGVSNCTYGIRVCEFKPETHQSLSDAIDDMSVLPLEQSLEYHEIPGNSRSFQYPTSGAMDLEPNHIYVWQIRREYATTLGNEQDFSDILAFRIADPSGSRLDPDQILVLLRRLLGDEAYDLYFGPGGELAGFNISGDSFILNERSIPLNQLIATLSEILNNDLEIIQSGVE